jgi:hypothetical protein
MRRANIADIAAERLLHKGRNGRKGGKNFLRGLFVNRPTTAARNKEPSAKFSFSMPFDGADIPRQTFGGHDPANYDFQCHVIDHRPER